MRLGRHRSHGPLDLAVEDMITHFAFRIRLWRWAIEYDLRDKNCGKYDWRGIGRIRIHIRGPWTFTYVGPRP